MIILLNVSENLFPKRSGSNTILQLVIGEKVLLTIYIPTYSRPDRAIETVLSCLEINDNRLEFFLHSNGYDEKLEFLRSYNKRLKYDCFAENKGAIENFKNILYIHNSKFVMYLSDEDKVVKENIKGLLNYLENECSDISVIASRTFLAETGVSRFSPNKSFKKGLDLSDTFSLFPSDPSYMSGLIFKTADFYTVNIDKVFSTAQGNAYPHLLLKLYMNQTGFFSVYDKPIIKIDVPDNKGGDAFSHRNKDVKSDNFVADLNPFYYSAYARCRQYIYYSDCMRYFRKKVSVVSYIFGQISIIIDLKIGIENAKSVVTQVEKRNNYQLFLSAMKEAEETDGATYSFFIILTHFLISLNNNFVFSILNKALYYFRSKKLAQQ